MARHRVRVVRLEGPCPIHRLGDELEIHDGYRLATSSSSHLCLIALETIRAQATAPPAEPFACTESCQYARGKRIQLQMERVDSNTPSGSVPYELQQALQVRDISILKAGPLERVLLPDPAEDAAVAGYYKLLKHYSFRLLLRDCIKHRDRFTVSQLTHYCNPETAAGYVAQMVSLGLAVPLEGNTFALRNRTVDNLGTTLEWFLATVLSREFGAAATFDARIKKAGKGGDYDCLALLRDKLLYLEIKSSPPKNIHQPEITQFLERARGIQASASVLIVDTQLRLEDKINAMVRWGLKHLYPDSPAADIKPVLEQDRYFVVQPFHVYIVNSKPDLLSNLKLCLKALQS